MKVVSRIEFIRYIYYDMRLCTKIPQLLFTDKVNVQEICWEYKLLTEYSTEPD